MSSCYNHLYLSLWTRYRAADSGIVVEKFLQCIELLKPTGQIHSDYCSHHGMPRNLYSFPKGVTGEELKTKLLPASTRSAPSTAGSGKKIAEEKEDKLSEALPGLPGLSGAFESRGKSPTPSGSAGARSSDQTSRISTVVRNTYKAKTDSDSELSAGLKGAFDSKKGLF